VILLEKSYPPGDHILPDGSKIFPNIYGNMKFKIEWLYQLRNAKLAVNNARSGPPSGAKNLCAVVALLAVSGASVIKTTTQSLGSAAAALSFSSIAGRHHCSRLPPLPPQVTLPLPLPAPATAAAACLHSRLLLPLTSVASRRQPPPSEVLTKMILMGHPVSSCHVPVVRSCFIFFQTILSS
jgi:hypothetical protein